MCKIGEYVMYGGMVMCISKIENVTFGDMTHEYYILENAVSPDSSRTYVPTDNEKLVSSMRPLLTKDEIDALIVRSKDIPDIPWQNDNRVRSDTFKKIMESCDREKIIGMIKAIKKMQDKRGAEGKKNYITDTNALQKARKILYAEAAFVLGIPEIEVGEYIRSRVKQ